MRAARPKGYLVFRFRGAHQNQQQQPVLGHDNPRHVLRPVPRFQRGKSPLPLPFLHDVRAAALPQKRSLPHHSTPYRQRAVFHPPRDTPRQQTQVTCAYPHPPETFLKLVASV